MVMQLSQSSSTEQTEVERQIVFESVLDLGTMRPDLLDTYVWFNLKEKELEVHTYDRSKPNCEIRTVAKAPFNEQNVAVEQYDFSSEKPTTVWLSGQEACNAISFFRAAKSMKCDKIHFRLWNKNNTHFIEERDLSNETLILVGYRHGKKELEIYCDRLYPTGEPNYSCRMFRFK